MTSPAELLADCNAHGIRLLAAGDGGLTIDAPQDALTPNLLGRLQAHKAELLALLRSPTNPPAVPVVAMRAAPATRARPICRCGSTTWHDIPIHDGQSIRRDCGRCRRFIDFPIWYGTDTFQNE